jgi:hypothetical protein
MSCVVFSNVGDAPKASGAVMSPCAGRGTERTDGRPSAHSRTVRSLERLRFLGRVGSGAVFTPETRDRRGCNAPSR